MWELDHKKDWAPKNWCFWTVVLEQTLESPLDSRRSSQSILKKINPEYPLQGLMLKLKLQYFSHLMQRADSLENTLMLGKTEDEMVGWHHRLNGHEFEQAPGDGEGQGSLRAAVHRVAKSRTWLRDWKTWKASQIIFQDFVTHQKVLSIFSFF